MESENIRLKDVRFILGLTLKDVASAIGYSIGAISGVENGHDTPSPRLRRSLVEFYRINDEWLRTGKGEPAAEGFKYPGEGDEPSPGDEELVSESSNWVSDADELIHQIETGIAALKSREKAQGEDWADSIHGLEAAVDRLRKDRVLMKAVPSALSQKKGKVKAQTKRKAK
jgi:transcriptional regulator with XRE-family HTH domain